MFSLIYSSLPALRVGHFRLTYDKNPRLHIRVRERFLLLPEWRRVQLVLDCCPIKVLVYFTLLILLACRRGELLAMEWAHLDLEFCIWYKPRTKNGRSQTLALSDAAVLLLTRMPHTSRYVFTGDPDHTGTKPDQHWSATAVTFWWRKIRTAAGCSDVWIHDLRRTLGAWMTMHGESLRIIQVIMNHADIRTTARVYTPMQIDTQRAALNRHAEQVMAR